MVDLTLLSSIRERTEDSSYLQDWEVVWKRDRVGGKYSAFFRHCYT